MMKVIQRDHKLLGYKLDDVSANFITENIKKFTESETGEQNAIINLYTSSTKALEKESFIQIMVNDGYSSSPLRESCKYRVVDINTVNESIYDEKEKTTKTFTLQAIKIIIPKKDVEELRNILQNKYVYTFWTFAKDDMHHTLLHKYYQEGDPKNIRKIGKYCIQDCKLVNLLLAKLEIIVNSIGMAKVCHVPVSYLFLRGQGVKIFSLVSKKCREKCHLIPVLSKRGINGIEDIDGYEGAIVINAEPGIYLSPIGVLDFSSLYPNSMREINASHECYLIDIRYDNLPGYLYHDVYITRKDENGRIMRDNNGEIMKEHNRFSQEIMTEEKINKELAKEFNKIETDRIEKIEEIKKNANYTEEYLISRINYLEEIVCNNPIK